MKEPGTITIEELSTKQSVGRLIGTDNNLFAPATKSDPVMRTLAHSGTELLNRQFTDGYWHFELEADTTIPAEYILYQYFMGTVDHDRHARLADYILNHQLDDGSWSLYESGPGNISATVKAYFVLKIIGHDPQTEYMQKAKSWIISHGGAENANVFTRTTLAIFGQLPWRTVPAMPAEIIWFPKWWIFNLTKVSYWSRCVIVPLLILLAYRPVHKFDPAIEISELFIKRPEKLKHIDKFRKGNLIRNLFIFVDRCLKILQHLVPFWLRKITLRKCEEWVRDHMRGEGGNGAIYPAMANAVMALKVSGSGLDDPDMVRGIKAIEDLVVENEIESYVQPCVSPVWDTCLSLSALSEAGMQDHHPAIKSATDWLFDKQVFIRGDWSDQAPDLESGGWAFQFENDSYPDVDDTSMVVMALLRVGAHKHPDKRKRIAQAVNWAVGMQNSDGGWGAFDINNHHEYLNNIPFADHGALIDPSTADLTARCIEMLTMLGYERDFKPIARGLEFIKHDQKECGGWFGRWGVNYIYGTFSVLLALGLLGEDPHQPYILKAIDWLKSIQNSDGGWGEECTSYDDATLVGKGISTASQTAWALMGLITIGEGNSESVERGVNYLIRNYEPKHGWEEKPYTGTGFPRVFYLRYHGYSYYFPIWALGLYRQFQQGQPFKQQSIRDSGKIDLGPLQTLRS